MEIEVSDSNDSLSVDEEEEEDDSESGDAGDDMSPLDSNVVKV